MSHGKGFNTKAVHAGSEKKEEKLNSAVMPIFQTSTFAFDNAAQGASFFSGEKEGYIYTRIGNPTIADLEKAVAVLERGCGGVATSSGMAAVNTVYMSFLKQGGHVICHEAVYGPSRVVLETIYPRFGVEASFIDATNIHNIERAIRPETCLLFLESPANPTLGITDIRLASELAHKHGIKVCVDNTFCSPYLQNPLELGADVVLHSMTKFINGHADVVAGMLVAKEEKDYKLIKSVMINLGFNMDPHQAFLVRRGLKTLGIRMEKSQQNALAIAHYLEKHPKIEWVKYPGLASHPQYELAKKQMKGPGAMISFELKGGIDAGIIMMNSVKIALLAVSLGGVETLIQHPASMTHSKIAGESRIEAGITDGLVRLSVGIEELDDLISDLEQALEKI